MHTRVKETPTKVLGKLKKWPGCLGLMTFLYGRNVDRSTNNGPIESMSLFHIQTIHEILIERESRKCTILE